MDYIFVTENICSLIERTDIMPSYATDHSMVVITIRFSNIDRGKGFWKMNTSMLRDNDYVESINGTIEEVMKQQFKTAREKWDFLKFKIKEASNKFTKVRKKSQEMKLHLYKCKLQRLHDNLEEVEDNIFTKKDSQKEIEKITKEIDELMEVKTKGAIMRSRVDWFLYGVKPSKYFCKLEKYNYTNKNRYKLKRNDGTVTTDAKEILNIEYNYYKDLYSEANLLAEESYLDDLKSPKLSKQQKAELDKDIDEKEIKNIIKQMKGDKVLGTDGIPIEFYRMFYTKISKLFFDVISEISYMEFTIDQGRGIILLIDKPGRNQLTIKNWRPLSLLNVDAKIYSKILASRLYEVIDTLVYSDQSGFQKGRYIGENLLDLLSIIEHSSQYDVPAVIASLDFEKAFDMVHWESFIKTLKFFNFGNRYIDMVKMLFTNIHSCTVNNGYSSNWFKPERGLRQGDCYSPPAFLLVIEILGLKIRQNQNIEGIQLAHITKKQVQFAYDLWASLKAKQNCLLKKQFPGLEESKY